MGGNATDFITSNYLKALDLEDGVIVKTVVQAARPDDFEGGETKLVISTDYKAKRVVLNQDRLKTMIEAFGPSLDNWTGKTIYLRRGPTMFKGKETSGIFIDVDRADRIAVRDLNVSAIGDHRRPSGPPVPPPPMQYDGPEDGDGDPTEDIPL
jgi:hypothetical protein